jgi:pimeloyl-ACP methyl ester carboxylesterase
MTSTPEVVYRLTVDESGTEIEFSDRGEGEPILLVHAGVFVDWFTPLAASRAMDGFRVIRMRRAGYLSGPPPAHHLTLGDHARHAGALLDELGIPAAHVCGLSSSGLIGLQLAMDRPASVASLILMDPAPGAVLQAPSQQQFTAAVARPAMMAAAAGDFAAAFDIWMGGVDPEFRRVLGESLGPDACDRALAESRFFFADELPAVREWALDRDRAADLDRPVLLVRSAESGTNFHEMVSLLAGVLPRADVTTLHGVGHLMPLQDPDGVGRLIADFARRHPSTPRDTVAASAAD